MMQGHPSGGAEGELRHEALIYDSDEGFLNHAVPFLRDGLAVGEPTLVGVNAHLTQLLCKQPGLGPGLTLLGTEHYQDPLAALRRTAALHSSHRLAGASRIRVLGGIPQDPWPDWLRYEASVNGLLAHCSIWGICPYDARSTSDEILDDVERTHPHVNSKVASRTRRVPFEDPLRLINRRNCEAGRRLRAALPDVDLINPRPARARRVLNTSGAETMLEEHELDALGLCTGALLDNARAHGRPPVRLQAWVREDRIDVLVRDAGRGPEDPLVGLLPRTDGWPGDPGTLHAVYQAVTSVAMYTDDDGFTVWLTQRATY